MTYCFSIGEALSLHEDGELVNYVDEKIIDGAPWYETRHGWATWSDNHLALNNNGTATLMTVIIPELFNLSYSNGFATGLINITQQVVDMITIRLNEIKTRITVRPYAFNANIDVHWAGILERMRWWCSWALKKCIYPVLTIT